MTLHRIESGGVTLSVREEGAGTPLLLLHGMWCRGTMFDALLPWLDGYRLVIPDLRAHGDSEVPPSGWALRDLARDCRIILQNLDTGPALVAGFSMGGMAALHFALKDPGLVRGLVLLGTSADAEGPVRQAQIRAVLGIIRLGWPTGRVAAESARMMFSRGFRRTHRAVVQDWKAGVRAMPRRALLQALAAVGSRPGLGARLSRLTLPVVIGAGQDDAVLAPRNSERLAGRLAGATLRMLPGVGHALPLERPEDTAAMIRDPGFTLAS